MKLEDFNFNLPPERIAQQAVRRGDSRLMVLPKKSGAVVHTSFRDLSTWLAKGDCLVVNDSKVIPARLYALKVETGVQIELLLHRETEPGIWESLARPYRRLKPGMQLKIGEDTVTVDSLLGQGRVQVRFKSAAEGKKIIRKYGITPLPPYIRRDFRRPDKREKLDRKRYQTIFASAEGSVAAPTAGLHFSPTVLKQLEQKGVKIVPITLHVGWGTFAPLSEDSWRQKVLHSEYFCVSESTAKTINACRRKGGRIIACGTTVARTLESASEEDGWIRAGSGQTDLFIYPDYYWKQVDGLLTNFHLPKSSLFILVCAFAGVARVQEAYHEAVRQHYRFYSYGDAMLCL